ncbi:MAG: T9SS type A sorting domain-containing protein [Bacteroidales bacterium]|nr:T9SS type A sorting domain-containing protein [Bacteroidales bacterium]
MNKSFLILLMLVLSSALNAQLIQLNIDQPDQLVADAGTDTLICKNHSVVLGASVVAYGGSPQYFYSWYPALYLDDPTLANPVCSPEETIIYVLTVTDASGCSSTSYVSVGVDPCLGISTIEQSSIHIYPNPIKDRFRISGLPITSDRLLITLVNQLGQKVYYSEFRSISTLGEIEVSFTEQTPPPGVYFIKLNFGKEYIVKPVQIY